MKTIYLNIYSYIITKPQSILDLLIHPQDTFRFVIGLYLYCYTAM